MTSRAVWCGTALAIAAHVMLAWARHPEAWWNGPVAARWTNAAVRHA